MQSKVRPMMGRRDNSPKLREKDRHPTLASSVGAKRSRITDVVKIGKLARLGLVVGSYQGCSEALHGLAREAAKATATAKWRQMGVRSVHEALGPGDASTRTTCTAAGVAFSGGRGRVIRGRLPVIGRPNADILHHGPPPAYAHGREAVGGAEARPQVHAPRRRARGTRGGRQACERLSAGWRVPAEPTMLRLNSHFLGF